MSRLTRLRKPTRPGYPVPADGHEYAGAVLWRSGHLSAGLSQAPRVCLNACGPQFNGSGRKAGALIPAVTRLARNGGVPLMDHAGGPPNAVNTGEPLHKDWRPSTRCQATATAREYFAGRSAPARLCQSIGRLLFQK